MQATPTLQQLSDAIVKLANQIAAAGSGAREKQYAAFINGTPAERARIVDALNLDPAQVEALVVSARQTAASNPLGKPGGPARQSQPWDYDTATVTREDLLERQALLQTRLRILQYLISH
jgi:hypothetical protein